MRQCIIIPCYNHRATVAVVARAAGAYCPVIVVDDGSSPPLPGVPDGPDVRLERNCGKAAALRAGFQRARELGFTHAITMDADGQHFASDIPRFLAAAQARPNALIVGVRDFYAARMPAARRRSNSVSTFGFRAGTGVRLADTQCGFRCYPLALARCLTARSERYAFELEFLVRAAWVGAPIVSVPIRCVYQPEHLQDSQFRPVADCARITMMHIGLLLQWWLVPQSLRVAWSFGERRSPRECIWEFFAAQVRGP